MPNQTGPNTPKGKAAVRHNAVKHGFYSHSPVLPGVEKEDEWLEHRSRVFEAVDPDDYLQEALAEQIAVNTWRRKRLVRWEVELVRNRQWDIAREVAKHATLRQRKPSVDNPDDIARAQRFLMDRLVPEGEDLMLLMRWEGRLHRQLFQLINQLHYLKNRRTRVVAEWSVAAEEREGVIRLPSEN